MYVVIFRAKIRSLDDEYPKVVTRMRELAMNQFGCLDFQSLSEGKDEVTLSYWRDEESIHAWKSHAEHVIAQQLGKERWYESYIVQVAQVTREYRVSTSTGDQP